MRTGGIEGMQAANGAGLAGGIFFNQIDSPRFDIWDIFGSRISKN